MAVAEPLQVLSQSFSVTDLHDFEIPAPQRAKGGELFEELPHRRRRCDALCVAPYCGVVGSPERTLTFSA